MAEERSPLVLLVEDDFALASMIRSALEASGYRTALATRVEEGWEAFREERPDLVLLDIGLPDGTGFELCRRIREAAGPTLPVIFMTGRGDVESRLEGFNAGGQDYVPKPIHLRELLARVRVHVKIRRSQEVLSRRQEELEAVTRSHQDLTDMIVHDLKAPLTAIRSTLDILKEAGLIGKVDYTRIVDSSRNAAEFMLLMINDLLDVGRAREGKLETEAARVDLAETVEKIRGLFDGYLKRSEIRLESRLPEDPVVETDPGLVFRVLANLVSNAIKWSEAGSVVELAVSRDGGKLRFEVLDRGPGVPEAQKRRIFEKFAKAAPETGRKEGSGIGLAFCRAAAESLGGRIWVEDREGGGSRFVVELPLTVAAAS